MIVMCVLKILQRQLLSSRCEAQFESDIAFTLISMNFVTCSSQPIIKNFELVSIAFG